MTFPLPFHSILINDYFISSELFSNFQYLLFHSHSSTNNFVLHLFFWKKKSAFESFYCHIRPTNCIRLIPPPSFLLLLMTTNIPLHLKDKAYNFSFSPTTSHLTKNIIQAILHFLCLIIKIYFSYIFTISVKHNNITSINEVSDPTSPSKYCPIIFHPSTGITL